MDWPPTADEIGLGRKDHEDAKRQPLDSKPRSSDGSDTPMEWRIPGHWLDKVHEEPGGAYQQSAKPQDGRDLYNRETRALRMKDGEMTAWDDVSGKKLEWEKVMEARRAEIEYFERMKVYSRVPRAHQRQTGGKLYKRDGLM